MIEYVAENYLALIEGGVIASLWIIARERRKAVDRLWDAIGEAWCDEDYPKDKTIARCGCRKRIEGYISLRSDDAPGRVIARSVERLTKENR